MLTGTADETSLGTAALVFAGVLGVSGCAEATAAWEQHAADAKAPELLWCDCGEGVQCAAMTVPVDCAKPDGAKTKVQVEKLPARDPRRRRGALEANFRSGASNAALMHAPRRPPSGERFTDTFDLVTLDARGIAHPKNELAIHCPNPPGKGIDRMVMTTEQGWQKLEQTNAAWDASCRRAMGEAFAWLTSWQTAHDLEALRAALGEKKLRYFGNPYGTTYAQA
ncbi:hypothetical protein [Allokutzneria albata]|uniref:hypothetical protein n=1 Tax=Allokutzneria albata TaxID=211114 RepID=UPI0004C345A9|nr:hypothetical protein [Allokutzneria albata]